MYNSVLLETYVVPAVFQEWDKPEAIPDPDATKPDDWDVDMDGEWEPAMIANPEYKVGLADLMMAGHLKSFHQ